MNTEDELIKLAKEATQVDLPKWTGLLVYNKDVFHNQDLFNIITDRVNSEYVFVVPRHADVVLYWFATPAKQLNAVSGKVLPMDGSLLMQLAEYSINFTNWPNGRITYRKDRMHGLSPSTSAIHARKRFEQQIKGWMKAL